MVVSSHLRRPTPRFTELAHPLRRIKLRFLRDLSHAGRGFSSRRRHRGQPAQLRSMLGVKSGRPGATCTKHVSILSFASLASLARLACLRCADGGRSAAKCWTHRGTRTACDARSSSHRCASPRPAETGCRSSLDTVCLHCRQQRRRPVVEEGLAHNQARAAYVAYMAL